MEFKLIKNTEEVILIEVLFENSLDKMSHKGFSGREKYIKYTKGKDHRITLYDENNLDYYVFDFGVSKTTIVSDDIRTLREKAHRFVLSQHIQPRNMKAGTETDLMIIQRHRDVGKCNHLCVHLGGEYAMDFKCEDEIREVFGDYEIMNSRNPRIQMAKLIKL